MNQLNKTGQGWPFKKRMSCSKYRNVKKSCALGHVHASKLEAEYCDKLRLLARARKISGFWVQKRYPIAIAGRKICDHVVDFLVLFPDGHTEIHETKGFQTMIWKLKYKMFRACYPEIPYYLIGG